PMRRTSASARSGPGTAATWATPGRCCAALGRRADVARQGHDEFGVASFLGLHAQLSLVADDVVVADREPEPRARTGGLRREERLARPRRSSTLRPRAP